MFYSRYFCDSEDDGMSKLLRSMKLNLFQKIGQKFQQSFVNAPVQSTHNVVVCDLCTDMWSEDLESKQVNNTHTVESGYNEHGYNEIPAIAKSLLGTEFSPVIFNIIKYGYNESGYSEITLIMKAGFPPNW